MNWQQLFAQHILDRGYDFFCDDAVKNIKYRNQSDKKGTNRRPAETGKIVRQVDEATVRDHFISYYEAQGFTRELEEYLYEDVRMMLDDGGYSSAFELTCHIFIKVGNVDMDDSDGGTEMLACHCQEI